VFKRETSLPIEHFTKTQLNVVSNVFELADVQLFSKKINLQWPQWSYTSVL